MNDNNAWNDHNAEHALQVHMYNPNQFQGGDYQHDGSYPSGDSQLQANCNTSDVNAWSTDQQWYGSDDQWQHPQHPVCYDQSSQNYVGYYGDQDANGVYQGGSEEYNPNIGQYGDAQVYGVGQGYDSANNNEQSQFYSVGGFHDQRDESIAQDQNGGRSDAAHWMPNPTDHEQGNSYFSDNQIDVHHQPAFSQDVLPASSSFSTLPHQPSAFDEITGGATSETSRSQNLSPDAAPNQQRHSRQSSFGTESVHFVLGGSANTSTTHSNSNSPHVMDASVKTSKPESKAESYRNANDVTNESKVNGASDQQVSCDKDIAVPEVTECFQENPSVEQRQESYRAARPSSIESGLSVDSISHELRPGNSQHSRQASHDAELSTERSVEGLQNNVTQDDSSNHLPVDHISPPVVTHHQPVDYETFAPGTTMETQVMQSASPDEHQLNIYATSLESHPESPFKPVPKSVRPGSASSNTVQHNNPVVAGHYGDQKQKRDSTMSPATTLWANPEPGMQ